MSFHSDLISQSGGGLSQACGPASCEFEAGYSWALLPVGPWVAMLAGGQAQPCIHAIAVPSLGSGSYPSIDLHGSEKCLQ